MRLQTGTVMIFLLAAISSCREPAKQRENIVLTPEGIIEASMQAVGSSNDRDLVTNITYFADCHSPKGAYTTELHSDTTGYTFFKQKYSFNKDSFVRVVQNRGKELGGIANPVSPETAFTIRSHEFMSILLELNKRFYDFKLADTLLPARREAYMLGAKDELGHDCWLHIDSTTLLLKDIRFQNPGNAAEMITTTFSAWRTVNGLNFPHHIEFTQGGGTYTFDIKTLKINDPGFKQIK